VVSLMLIVGQTEGIYKMEPDTKQLADASSSLRRFELTLGSHLLLWGSGMIGALLANGAQIDVPDVSTGKTALIKAAYAGHDLVVDSLLQHGAGADLTDEQGYSAVAFAACFNHFTTLQVLLAFGANPSSRDEFGVTPLIHAAARGYCLMVELLIEAGAEPGAVDVEGKAAFDYAASAGHQDVIAVLAKAGAAEPSSVFEGQAISGLAPRMTPRVPISAPPAPTTPRASKKEQASTGMLQCQASGHVPSGPPAVGAKALGSLDTNSLRFLSKKLCNLAKYLERDTLSMDTAYPKFEC